MVFFNYATKEITAKIVYYGPGLSGKTTNLQYIYNNLPEEDRGNMVSLATSEDRTLFFDFMPIEIGSFKGIQTTIQLYTVPGQVVYDTTRKLVLKGADGIVFVADSQKELMDSNLESVDNLEKNLREQGINLKNIPHILQFNKRDLLKIAPVEELNRKLNRYGVPHFEAIAIHGIGVYECLREITLSVMSKISRELNVEEFEAEPIKAEDKVPVPSSLQEEEPVLSGSYQEEAPQEEPEELLLETSPFLDTEPSPPQEEEEIMLESTPPEEPEEEEKEITVPIELKVDQDTREIKLKLSLNIKLSRKS